MSITTISTQVEKIAESLTKLTGNCWQSDLGRTDEESLVYTDGRLTLSFYKSYDVNRFHAEGSLWLRTGEEIIPISYCLDRLPVLTRTFSIHRDPVAIAVEIDKRLLPMYSDKHLEATKKYHRAEKKRCHQEEILYGLAQQLNNCGAKTIQVGANSRAIAEGWIGEFHIQIQAIGDSVEVKVSGLGAVDASKIFNSLRSLPVPVAVGH